MKLSDTLIVLTAHVRATVLVLAVTVGGCAGAPVQEMSNARQAITAAVEAGGEAVAADELARARRLLDSAQTKLQEKDFRGARQDAVSARMSAARALEATGSGADDDSADDGAM